jgi:hypothetical protein
MSFIVFTLHQILGDQIKEYEMCGVSSTRKMRNSQIFVGRPEGKRALGRYRWED